MWWRPEVACTGARGPAGDGRSDSQGLPLTWSETENVVWKTPIHDSGWSSPVVWDNQIWLTTFPYHPERSFADEHALLAFRVGLARFQLVGAAAHAGTLTDELVVETIQAFDKYVDGHDFWDRTFRLMQREQALDPASLAALLLA